MSAPFRFPGIPAYLRRDGLNPTYAAKIPSLWFLGRVADALSQIPETAPKNRAEMFRVAREAIEGLRVALDTAVIAFDDVMRHCPPPATEEDIPVPLVDPIATMRPAPIDAPPIPMCLDPEVEAVDTEPAAKRRGRPPKDIK